ncbi:SHD1 domain-containing protein [Bremerella sp.]|uniref:SHD1 domain-containing protein n=1 Tax=Bremerella sp. TaxID=2795602 RepID=UPI003918CEFA
MRYRQQVSFLVLVLFVAFLSDARVVHADPPEVSAKPLRCALIDVDQSALVGLVEADLITRTSEEWLERTEINRLLEEKQLQLLLSAGAGDDRVALGQTLKADVLVMLRTTKEQQKTSVELVVAETNQGLRLLTQSFVLGDNLEEHATALVALIDQAITKARQEIRQVFAVPPFVSDDLTYEYDYLKSSYAKLLEHSLLDSPGVLIVELEEAQAIASELALTSESGTIKRRLPIYLLGQYRNEGKEEERKVRVSLSIQQGSKELNKLQAELTPEAVAEFLRESASKIAETQGIEAKVVSPAVEAEQLNKRAQQFAQLGNWSEALGLIEASLMLYPDQPEIHSEAIRFAGQLANSYNGHKLNELAKARELSRRSLSHLGILIANYPPEHSRQHFRLLYFSSGSRLKNHDASSPLLLEQIEREKEYQREKHRLATQLAQKYAEVGDWRSSATLTRNIVHVMRPAEGYAELTRKILQYQDRPGVSSMVRAYAHGGYTVDILRSLEGRRFLNALLVHADTNEQVKQTAQQLLDAIDVEQKEENVQTTGDPDNETLLTFRRVELTYQTKSGQDQKLNWMEGCVPLNNGVDAFYNNSGLFALSPEEGLRHLWQAPRNTFIQKVAYDGKYVWVAASVHQQAAQVWVFDPVSGDATQLTTADGLPLLSPDEIPGTSYVSPTVSLTTIAEGRAIVVGAIGRTWLADVRFSPEGEHQVQVFHEAKEIVTITDREADWQSIDLAFQPVAVRTMSVATESDSRKQVVMISRGCPVYGVTEHALLVDPEDLSVKVSASRWHNRTSDVDARGMRDGSVYYAGAVPPAFDSIGLIRVGLPDFKPEVAIPGIREGDLFFNQSGEVNVVGVDWQRGKLEDGKLESYGPVPWLYSNHWGASEKSPPIRFERGSFQMRVLADSNNFGTIMSCSEIDGPSGIIQVLFDGTGVSLKDALNGVQVEQREPTAPQAIAQTLPVEDRNLWQRPPRCLSLAYSPDNALIVTAGRAVHESLQVWNGADGQLIANLQSDSAGITRVVFSHNGQMFATGGSMGRVIVWDAKTLQPLTECQGQSEEIFAMAFSWNDDLLAAAGRDRTASIWSVPKGKHLYDVERKNMGIHWIGFSADDSLLLTSSHSTSEAWNASDGTMVGSIESVARAAGYLEDRTLIAIGDDADNTLIKWNSIDATSELLWPGLIGYPVAISRDGQLLAIYVRDLFIDNEWKEIYRVEVWDLPSKTKLTSVDGILDEGYAFTPANDALLITLYRGGLRRVEIPQEVSRPSPLAPAVPTTRTWTDNTGKHTREGIFQSVQGELVQLKTPEGQSIFVPLDRLSAEDQKYVREQNQR